MWSEAKQSFFWKLSFHLLCILVAGLLFEITKSIFTQMQIW